MRASIAFIHRYVGLVLASFLILTSVTGCIIVWYDELDRAVWPALRRVEPPAPGAQPLDPLTIREHVLFRYSRVSPDFVQIGRAAGQPLLFDLMPDDSSSDDELWIDPYTGDELGRREWGALSQGSKNLLPFLFKFHRSLALGSTGELVMGVVGLLWVFGCFTGLYLTLPPARPFFARWKSAWSIDRKRFSYDLHRASGLWAWAMMLVLAWSAVSFNLNAVYSPVTAAFLELRDHYAEVPDVAEPYAQPLSFAQAREIGRALVAEQSRTAGFEFIREDALSYEPDKGMYRFRMTTDRDAWAAGGASELWFDARSGEFIKLKFPTGQSSGDTVTTWLQGLHRAKVGGAAYQIFLSIVAVIVLGATLAGVLIWWRKRESRRRSRKLRAAIS